MHFVVVLLIFCWVLFFSAVAHTQFNRSHLKVLSLCNNKKSGRTRNLSCFSAIINLKCESQSKLYAKIQQKPWQCLMFMHLKKNRRHFGLCTHLFNEKKISVMMRTNGEQSILSVAQQYEVKQSFVVWAVFCCSFFFVPFFWHNDISTYARCPKLRLKASARQKRRTHITSKKKTEKNRHKIKIK